MGCKGSKPAAAAPQPADPKTLLASARAEQSKAAAKYREVPFEIAADESLPDLSEVPVYDQVFGNIDSFADKPAFVETVGDKPERVLTFADVRERVRALAKGLIARGVTKGITVAPINPTYETRELLHHLTEASTEEQKVALIATVPMAPFQEHAGEAAQKYADENGLSAPLPILNLFGADLDALINEGRAVSDADLDARKAGIKAKTDCAILPSSSGTTGPPKCVELSHFNIVTNLQQCAKSFGLTPDDVTVAFLPFFHAFGFTMFVTVGVMSGMKTVIMPKFDPKEYLALIAKHQPTQLHVVPPVANALGKLAPDDALDSVKAVLCAAAPLSAEQQAALEKKLKNGIVHQAYGMTELSPVAHFANVLTDEQKEAVRKRTGTIGKVVAGTSCRLVKIEGEDDPARGQVQIKGPQVMVGYRNRPEQTQATILDDGWLDTGDVAVCDQDGYFWIVDRVKELIKVKGFQVAPAELEGLLNQHSGVKECVVIGIEHDRTGEAPKAFVSLNPGVELTAEELYKALEEHLSALGTSDFKRLKGGVEVVQDVMKTASGKLLRKDYRLMEKKRREGAEPPPSLLVCYVPAK